MKITQKNLKAKHFRYVTRKVIRNPMWYLNDFSVVKPVWLGHINLLLNAATYSDLADPEFQDNMFSAKQLIEQVEVAYVVFRQCNLKKQPKPLTFFITREDHVAYFEGRYTIGGKVDPADTLSKFFSFQSLKKWYQTLDDICLYVSRPTGAMSGLETITVIRELLLRLARAMFDIYEARGLCIDVPSYFIARPAIADRLR